VTVQIARASSPESFVGSDDPSRQVLQIECSAADGPFTVQVAGDSSQPDNLHRH